MSEVEKIYQIIDGYRDEVIELQKALTAKVALGPEYGGAGGHGEDEGIRRRFGSIEASGP